MTDTQQTNVPEPTADQRIEALEHRVEELERKLKAVVRYARKQEHAGTRYR